MKALILAAGYGKRMSPLTDVIPKPALPICNIPLIKHQINIICVDNDRQLAFLIKRIVERHKELQGGQNEN